MTETKFRKPTSEEQALLNRLLEAKFPGRDELAPLLHSVQVKTMKMAASNFRAKSKGKQPSSRESLLKRRGKTKTEPSFTCCCTWSMVGPLSWSSTETVSEQLGKYRLPQPLN